MDDVARTAGVSRLIVYRNFDSKSDLYAAVLDSVLIELRDAFAAVELPVNDAVRVMLPVARAHSAAFRLLWRHATHETPFRDRSELLLERIHDGARAAFEPYIVDPVRLDWASRTGGAHLMEGICAWIDVTDDATRDDEVAEMIGRGLRGLARIWSDVDAWSG